MQMTSEFLLSRFLAKLLYIYCQLQGAAIAQLVECQRVSNRKFAGSLFDYRAADVSHLWEKHLWIISYFFFKNQLPKGSNDLST